MQIKHNKDKSILDIIPKIFNLPIIKLLIFLLLFSSYTIFIAYIFNFNKSNFKSKIPLSIKSRIKDTTLYHLYQSNFKVNIPLNILKANFTKTNKIFIDVKLKDFQVLNKKRQDAINNFVLTTSNEDYVPAILSRNDEKLDAKIRLKGDWTDHLIGNKWSFRVKINDGKTLNGLNKFSLQSPKTRRFIWEWLYHEILRIEGFPALRYSFAPLVFNGNDLGIYAIEEHFDKVLIESNKYKEGPIIKLSEDLLWLGRKRSFQDKVENIDPHKQITRSDIEVFKKNYTLKKKNLSSNFIRASQKMNSFFEGSLKTSEVFDSKKLATFLAITDLINANHNLFWHNQRFYFDPFSELLIPIGFDGDAGRPLERLAIDKPINTINYFEDLEFTKLYVSELERLSSSEYINNLFLKIYPEINRQLSILHKSYPAITFNKKIIIDNQKKIINSINPISPLNIYFKNKNFKDFEINVANNQSFPIQILGLYQKNLKIGNPDIKTVIAGKSKDNFPKYEVIKFSKENNKDYVDKVPIYVYYKIYGSSNIKKIEVNPIPKLDPNISNEKIPNISEFNFLIQDKENKTIFAKQGKWQIDKPLIIPSGKKFIIKGNTTIEIIKNGFIYSNSPVEFIGDKDQPIIFKGNQIGNGIAIVNAEKKSFIKNVLFNNLSNPRNEFWEVPGSITFYQSPVDIQNSIFEANNSEDNLNIVRSKFSIKNTSFLGSKLDAIDIDFSDGLIQNISIIKAGNDGLDISGSKINANEIFIKDIGDKGISGGEMSFLNAKNISIFDSNIAFASKDKSILELNDISIDKAEIGFAIFQKKEEYGSATINVGNITSNLVKNFYLLEKKSSLVINEKNYRPNSINLRSKLY